MLIEEMFNPNKKQPSQMSKDSLNKYKKKGQKKQRRETYQKQSSESASKNQFKKYFLDAVNVFYEDRQTLKMLQETRVKIKIFLPLWFCLAITYMVVSRIQPYTGHCPEHATCKVFVRCNPGYELSTNGKQCKVESRIIEKIENVCKFEIETLKHEYGNADCLENITNNQPPFKPVIVLFEEITKTIPNPTIKIEIEKKVHDFLNNETNQMQYEFDVLGGNVVPLTKKHSFGCWLSLTSKTTEFKVILVAFILLSVLGVWYYKVYQTERKVKEIYQYLKAKVQTEDKVNITLINDEIKTNFGPLDQSMWIKVNEERKKDGKIGYFEDEFLYWKLLR